MKKRKIMLLLKNCIGPTIGIGPASWCLPYAEFFSLFPVAMNLTIIISHNAILYQHDIILCSLGLGKSKQISNFPNILVSRPGKLTPIRQKPCPIQAIKAFQGRCWLVRQIQTVNEFADCQDSCRLSGQLKIVADYSTHVWSFPLIWKAGQWPLYWVAPWPVFFLRQRPWGRNYFWRKTRSKTKVGI